MQNEKRKIRKGICVIVCAILSVGGIWLFAGGCKNNSGVEELSTNDVLCSEENELVSEQKIYSESNETVEAENEVTSVNEIIGTRMIETTTARNIEKNTEHSTRQNEEHTTKKEVESSKNKISTDELYPLKHSDDTATVTIYKEWYKNAWCYIAHIQLKDYTRFKTVCANGAYGNGYEKTSSVAKRLNALLAVNGCYSAPKLNYIVVRDGIVCNGGSRYCTLPAIYDANSGMLHNVWETGGNSYYRGQTVNWLVNNNQLTDTFCFGPPLLSESYIYSKYTNDRAQRTFLGATGTPGELWLVVSDGRYNDGVSAGLNGAECASLLRDKGCVFGIPLDGGGSSTMVYKGKILNANASNERAVVDFCIVTN